MKLDRIKQYIQENQERVSNALLVTSAVCLTVGTIMLIKDAYGRGVAGVGNYYVDEENRVQHINVYLKNGDVRPFHKHLNPV